MPGQNKAGGAPDTGGSVRVTRLSHRPTALPGLPRGAHGAARHSWRVLATLSALMGFASISTDLYLPAMPAMGRALGADAGTVELTVSGYLIGFSLGQLLWGPIGDRYGRRGPVAIGLVLFVIGSAGCALAGSTGAMIGWRVVQAVGACAGVVLARAMVRDLYAGARAAQMLSTLMTVMAVAPLLGPIVGGQILGWPGGGRSSGRWSASASHARRALYPARNTAARAAQPRAAWTGHRDLWRALRQRRLIGYAAAGGFFYAGMFAYIAGTPFAYISYHHVPPQLYGLLFGTGHRRDHGGQSDQRAAGDAARQRRGCCGRGRSERRSRAHCWRQRTNGLGRLGGACRPVVPVCRHGRVHHCELDRGRARELPTRAGAASALVGSIQYGAGIIGSALVGAFADGTPWPLGWVIAGAGLGRAPARGWSSRAGPAQAAAGRAATRRHLVLWSEAAVPLP